MANGHAKAYGQIPIIADATQQHFWYSLGGLHSLFLHLKSIIWIGNQQCFCEAPMVKSKDKKVFRFVGTNCEGEVEVKSQLQTYNLAK